MASRDRRHGRQRKASEAFSAVLLVSINPTRSLNSLERRIKLLGTQLSADSSYGMAYDLRQQICHNPYQQF